MWKSLTLVLAVALLSGGAAQGARTSAPVNTTKPTISGTPRAGETLTAGSGTWSGSTPMTFQYRWQRCDRNGNNCSNIGGATNQTYQLQRSDTDRRIRVSVTATNTNGSANAVSDPTGQIARGAAPQNTAVPTISGTAKAGQTLSGTNGSWNNKPTSYEYRWRRCDTSGGNCHDVGPNRSSYSLSNDDVGATIRLLIEAKNEFGTGTATSAPTAIVAPAGPLPVNTGAPGISGLARDGQTLVATTGNWSNSPTRYAFQWLRCDSTGNNCANFGSSGQSQKLSASEVGRTVRVTVSATNQYGTTRATSAQTAVVTAATTSTAVPVSQISLPNHLLITGVKFLPARLSSRSAFLARFRVSDSSGRPVSGALVYGLGIPYGWTRNAPEVVTGGDGWATIQFFPTRLMPIHRRAALVMFVRARKPGENLLGGVSTRRLVQVRIG